MNKNDLLAALALPNVSVHDKPGSKSKIARYAPDRCYKERILTDTASVHWLGTILMSPEVPGHLTDERHYSEISFNLIQVTSRCHIGMLAEALHCTYPNPTVLFFARDGQIMQVSIAHKRRSDAASCNHILSGAINRCELPSDPAGKIYAPFWESVRWPNLPKKDLFDVYSGWYERVNALKAGNVTGEFRIAATEMESARRQELLDQYAKLHFKRSWATKTLPDMFTPEEKSKVQHEIATLNQSMNEIVKSLRVSHEPDDNTPPRVSIPIRESMNLQMPAEVVEGQSHPHQPQTPIVKSPREILPNSVIKYQLRRGSSCLFCRSPALMRALPQDAPALQEGMIELDVTCLSCGETWIDQMTIGGVVRRAAAVGR